MIKINLLPRTARKAAAPDRRLLLGGAVGILVFLGGGYAWWTVGGEAADLQRRIGATKAEIQRLVSEENFQAPLSDAALAHHLAQSNISIARRTIAKYRASLKILPARLRRQPR